MAQSNLSTKFIQTNKRLLIPISDRRLITTKPSIDRARDLIPKHQNKGLIQKRSDLSSRFFSTSSASKILNTQIDLKKVSSEKNSTSKSSKDEDCVGEGLDGDQSSSLSVKTKSKKKKKTKTSVKKVKAKAPKKLVPPKRPMNIMQLVTQDVISEIKSREGKLSKEAARESFKIAAERHRSLSESQKKDYVQRLEQMKEEYEVEMKNFLDSLTPDDYINQNEYVRRRKALGRPSRRRGIPRLDPNAPKRPLNGFMIFCADIRSNPSKFPDLDRIISQSSGGGLGDGNLSLASSVTEGSKVLANYWKNMSDNLKQKYILEGQRRSDLYKQAKVQYDAQSKALTEKLQQLKV